MAYALRTDFEGFPDAGRTRRLTGVTGQAQAAIPRFAVKIREQAGWTAFLITAQPDCNHSVPDALGGRPTHRRFGPDGDAGEYVARVASSIEADGLSIETIVVADPIGPLEGLLAYLSAHPAGLVAVATHAREGFTRLVHRRMTAQLVDRCPCPVVALPIRDWQQ